MAYWDLHVVEDSMIADAIRLAQWLATNSAGQNGNVVHVGVRNDGIKGSVSVLHRELVPDVLLP